MDCAASSITGRRWARAISAIFSISAGSPKRWTGIIALVRLKATPVFVEINRETYNLDATRLEAAITRRTKAIMPVHLFGLPAEMEKIAEIARAHRLPVIEDAAQSIGARYHDRHVGNIGACGCFSFFPSKNLGGAGDGGMVTTNDPELAERISVLRDHGGRKKYHYDLVGMNSRLDSLQAAILLVKFKHFEVLSKARWRNADRYRQLFRQAGWTSRSLCRSSRQVCTTSTTNS